MLEHMMRALVKKGCYPCVSYRGQKDGKAVYRAHVNGSGSFWEDAAGPTAALRKARQNWEKAGCPMDGYAVTPKGRSD